MERWLHQEDIGMYKVMVFAGTTEGYSISRFLAEHRISVCACVATEYGSKSLVENEYLKVRIGRLTAEEMAKLLEQEAPELVLDATHPYAAEVTENIRTACEKTGVSYQRVLRKKKKNQLSAVYVEDTEAAVAYLEQTTGNILLTTGSKELEKFTKLTGYQERIYARVLSLASVLEACHGYGIEGKHLIGMQGPFSREMNVAMLRQYDCAWLVTKDSGKAGGFQEKLEAAQECGVTPVIIGRPLKEEGVSVGACRTLLAERFGFQLKPRISLVGIGMGSRESLTLEAARVLDEAELLTGARRMVEAVRQPGQDIFCEYQSEAIAAYIQQHPEYEKIAVVLSGDVGFYSGARKLLELLGEGTQVICGISSVAYFMSKIGLSWDDAVLASAHGRACNLISLIRHHEKVFAILGTKTGVAELAKKLCSYGMGEVLLHVGENLSYENENIFTEKAEGLTDYEGDALCVICACNPDVVPRNTTHGIPDSEFLRGKVPMTKEEVRTVSLSKLRLTEDAVCYDIGAGTGSVSIEMALRAAQGRVYAIEKKEEAVELLKANRQKFAADNLEILQETAPAGLEALPAPTHAFIGGSSGNLREILKVLTDKNPKVRIVINCITLETITEALEAVRELGFEETEIVQLSAARAKELGRYHMMMGENPIYIITCMGVQAECADRGDQK